MNYSSKKKSRIIPTIFFALCCVVILGDHALPQHNNRYEKYNIDYVRGRIEPAHKTWEKYANVQSEIARQQQRNREETIREMQRNTPSRLR